MSFTSNNNDSNTAPPAPVEGLREGERIADEGEIFAGLVVGPAGDHADGFATFPSPPAHHDHAATSLPYDPEPVYRSIDVAPQWHDEPHYGGHAHADMVDQDVGPSLSDWGAFHELWAGNAGAGLPLPAASPHATLTSGSASDDKIELPPMSTMLAPSPAPAAPVDPLAGLDVLPDSAPSLLSDTMPAGPPLLGAPAGQPRLIRETRDPLPVPEHVAPYSSFVTSSEPREVLEGIVSFLEERGVDHVYKAFKNKVKGVVYQNVAAAQFCVEVFTLNKPSPAYVFDAPITPKHVVEVQRRSGCCRALHSFYNDLVAELSEKGLYDHSYKVRTHHSRNSAPPSFHPNNSPSGSPKPLGLDGDDDLDEALELPMPARKTMKSMPAEEDQPKCRASPSMTASPGPSVLHHPRPHKPTPMASQGGLADLLPPPPPAPISRSPSPVETLDPCALASLLRMASSAFCHVRREALQMLAASCDSVETCAMVGKTLQTGKEPSTASDDANLVRVLSRALHCRDLESVQYAFRVLEHVGSRSVKCRDVLVKHFLGAMVAALEDNTFRLPTEEEEQQQQQPGEFRSASAPAVSPAVLSRLASDESELGDDEEAGLLMMETQRQVARLMGLLADTHGEDLLRQVGEERFVQMRQACVDGDSRLHNILDTVIETLGTV